MKSKERYLPLFALFIFNANAQQNLVRNWSFEDTLYCPTGADFGALKNWINPTTGSPDYYNFCDTSKYFGVPTNAFGFQNPHSGSAYAGFVLHGGPQLWPNNDREYLEQLLVDSLKANKTYCIKFFLNLADIDNYATSRIGVLLTDTFISNTSGSFLYCNPSKENPFGNFLADKNNWMEVSFIFSANKGEKYLTIGNFKNDMQTDTLYVTGGTVDYGYYYIDDISIVEISSASAGNDTTYCTLDTARIGGTPTFGADYVWSKLNGNAFIDSTTIARPKIWANSSGTSTFAMQKTQCSVVTYDTVNISFNCVGMKENNFDELFSVYPNPAGNEIIISSKKMTADYSINIFDVAGRKIFIQKSSSDETLKINTREFENGIYFLSITSEKVFSQKKIIVQH